MKNPWGKIGCHSGAIKYGLRKDLEDRKEMVSGCWNEVGMSCLTEGPVQGKEGGGHLGKGIGMSLHYDTHPM